METIFPADETQINVLNKKKKSIIIGRSVFKKPGKNIDIYSIARFIE